MEPQVLLSRLMDTARKAGARGAEALLCQCRELSLVLREAELAPVRENRSAHLRLTVYREGGRKGEATLKLPRLRPPDAIPTDLIEEALARAASAAADPHEGPADRYDIDARGLGLRDRRQDGLQISDRRELVRENAIDCVAVSPDITLEHLTYTERATHRSFASTRGVSAEEPSSYYALVGKAHWAQSDRPLTDGTETRHYANIASMPIGTELGRRLERLHRVVPLPSEDLPLILDGSALAHLLRALTPAFAGSDAYEGRTFLKTLGEKPLAGNRLHVIDDPGISGGLRSRAFDDRGVPPSPVVFIREGRAGGLLLDPHTARRCGQRPTGHVEGDQVKHSNLVVRPGTRSRNAIGMNLADYLVVENFHEPRPVDIRTGRVRTGADLLLFRDNEIQGTCLGVRFDLPAWDLLGAITEIAGDQSRYADVDSCSVLLGTLGQVARKP